MTEESTLEKRLHNLETMFAHYRKKEFSTDYNDFQTRCENIEKRVKGIEDLYIQRINSLQNRMTNFQESFAKIHNTVVSIEAGLKDRNLREYSEDGSK